VETAILKVGLQGLVHQPVLFDEGEALELLSYDDSLKMVAIANCIFYLHLGSGQGSLYQRLDFPRIHAPSS
jgi:hypothetical protein